MTDEAASGPGGLRWSRARWFQVGGLGAMALGVLMPWASAAFISVNGLDTDDGKLFAVLLLGAAVVVTLHEKHRGRWWIAVLATAVVLVGFAVYEIAHVYSSRSGSIIPVSPGTGLWVDAVGAGLLGWGR